MDFHGLGYRYRLQIARVIYPTLGALIVDNGRLSRGRSPEVNAPGRFLTYEIYMLAFRT